MIKIEETYTAGWEHAIRGMRNAKESWDKSDSRKIPGGCINFEYAVGRNDVELMMKLAKAGTDHSKFMRMIVVWCDITAPMYWWKEFDTYKVGTVRNSCSTMHKLHTRDLTPDDFSFECIIDGFEGTQEGYIDLLNHFRWEYLQNKDKDAWYSMIQLLPSSYNQKSTVMLSYQVLRNMYHSRKNHKLDEWKVFCKWIEELPYSELITEV